MGEPPAEPFALLIGATNTESATSRLRVGGLTYVRKLLYSNPSNWTKIIEILADPGLKYVLAAITSSDYDRMCRQEYDTVTTDLFKALAAVPHIVLVHEAVYFSEPAEPAEAEEAASLGVDSFTAAAQDAPAGRLEERYGTNDLFMDPVDFFGPMDDGVRRKVNAALDSHQINVLPYRTNVERSTLAASFIDDNERGLLFRIYVPSGRLYAGEADTLLRLFRDWITKTGRNSIRQDGYQTPAGQVFEFFGSRRQDQGELSQQFKDFSAFLDACVDDPSVAVSSLEATGMSNQLANQMVSRCSTQSKRLQLDLRHTREERVMLIKHELESELLESMETVPTGSLETLVESMVPMPGDGIGSLLRGGSVAPSSAVDGANTFNVNVSQQFIQNASGVIANNIDGRSGLGPEALQLLEMVKTYSHHAGDDDYVAAIHEMEDDDARPEDRITARQKLKRFLGRVGTDATGLAMASLQKYVEMRVGI